MSDPCSQALTESVAIIGQLWPRTPRIAVVLGSGLGEIADGIDCEACIPYAQLPSFPQSTAAGHKGCVVCGTLDGVPIVALVGRAHLYDGYSTEQLSLPVRLIHALGARVLVLTNAAGGLNPRFHRGNVMVIRNHLCFQNLRLPEAVLEIEGANNSSILLPISAYDDLLADCLLAWSRRNGSALQQGVYVAVIGPNYETRAEYRMFRNLGGDAVGMSTAIEAVVAARLGLRTIGLSMIANVALPDCPKRVTHEEVLAAGELARPVIEGIVRWLAASEYKVRDSIAQSHAQFTPSPPSPYPSPPSDRSGRWGRGEE